MTRHSALGTQHLKLISRYSLLITLLLLAACAQATATPPLPTLIPSLVPSLTDTVPPTSAPDVTATADITPEGPTPTPVVITLEALLGQHIEPPLDITLPVGWQVVGYDTLALADVDTIRAVPLAVYRGPVIGGTGFIVLLWGFPNLVRGNPLDTQAVLVPDLWADGHRLLRLALLEQGCNVGTDLRREYRVGELTAVGTQFSAVDCPELPDTRGWFAGLQLGGLNYMFYLYTDPIEAMREADDELQAILDTVRFDAQTTP